MFAFRLRLLTNRDFLALSKNNGKSNLNTLFCEYEKSSSSHASRNIHSLRNRFAKTVLLSNLNEHQSILKRFVGLPPKNEKPLSPITWKTVLWTLIIGGGFTGYLLYLKEKKKEMREKARTASIGKAQIGGKFDLVSHSNVPVTSDDLLGQWLLIYFGFTHCPDVCPDEIEKMVKVVDIIDNKVEKGVLKPLFITVDPERDSPSAVGAYVKEFSDKLIGLTGTKEQIEKACKAYRVYFSAGPRDSDNDYIVDHTIIIYFVGPDGSFIDYFTQTKTAEQIAHDIELYMMKHEVFKSKGIMKKLRTIF